MLDPTQSNILSAPYIRERFWHPSQEIVEHENVAVMREPLV
jgi:hypothetical protein